MYALAASRNADDEHEAVEKLLVLCAQRSPPPVRESRRSIKHVLERPVEAAQLQRFRQVLRKHARRAREVGESCARVQGERVVPIFNELESPQVRVKVVRNIELTCPWHDVTFIE